jgi:23S rRNA pseudouridine2605 synthase
MQCSAVPTVQFSTDCIAGGCLGPRVPGGARTRGGGVAGPGQAGRPAGQWRARALGGGRWRARGPGGAPPTAPGASCSSPGPGARWRHRPSGAPGGPDRSPGPGPPPPGPAPPGWRVCSARPAGGPPGPRGESGGRAAIHRTTDSTSPTPTQVQPPLTD